jgi:alkylated DNA repair dioxygenase AlkB
VKEAYKSAEMTTESSEQVDLFDGHDPIVTVDASFVTAKRIDLDQESWIEVVPGWLSGASALFDELYSTVPWRAHDRIMFGKRFPEPRLTASYDIVRPEQPIVLRQAVQALTDHYGVIYDGLWMNLYRNGGDSTGWHRDHRSCRLSGCIVPILTLGATRRFLVKPRQGGRSVVFRPRAGDLVVMGGRSQQDWVHSVPKEPNVGGSRISVNFQSSAQAAGRSIH